MGSKYGEKSFLCKVRVSLTIPVLKILGEIPMKRYPTDKLLYHCIKIIFAQKTSYLNA